MKTDTYKGFETVSGRSETVPNQALSIREIMIRSTRGQYLPEVAGNQLQYGEDDDPDQDGLGFEDKFDALDHASYLEQRVNEYKAALKAQKAQKPLSKAPAEHSEAPAEEAPETPENAS